MLRQVTTFDDSLLLGSHTRASLRTRGFPERELYGPLWRRTTWGHYAWAATDAAHVRQRIHVAAGRRRSVGVVTGWAAAWLHGARDLDGLDPYATLPTTLPVPICTTPEYRLSGRSAPEASVRVVRSRLASDDVIELDGVPCASLVRTAFDAARLAPDLTEAVVTLDALLRDTPLPLEQLVAYADERHRWRGRPQLLRACELATPRVRSCPESRLRVLWSETCGLPDPLVNASIVDHRGTLVAIADLLDEDAWLVVEYDGAYHSAAVQRGRDDERTQRLSALGLHVVRVVAPDLHPDRRAVTAMRLTALRTRRLREVDGRPRRWTTLVE